MGFYTHDLRGGWVCVCVCVCGVCVVCVVCVCSWTYRWGSTLAISGVCVCLSPSHSAT